MCVFAADVPAKVLDEDADLFSTHVAQLGVDAWRLSPKTPETLLMLPTNSEWHYKSVSPWLTFDGQMTVHRNAVLSLKVRADQAMGTHVDEMSLDWSLSPSLGFKAGVVGYKTSWCRTYDVDSPWVRENDPFCMVKTTSDASGGAPGLQVYANAPIGNYRVQGAAGIYRPLLLNYNTTEFSNVPYPNARIDRNNKKGLSISAQNLETATEFRLGLLSADQSEHVFGSWNTEPFRVHQTYNMVFVGAAFYLSPQVQVRVQTLRHDMLSNNRSVPGSVWPSYLGGVDLARRSDVVEINYWHSSQDVFAFAVSRYTYDNSYTVTNYPDPGYVTDRNYYVYKNKNMSASWRHDWAKGFYTAVQWSYNALDLYNRNITASPSRDAGGHGLGVRLGYQF
ncbi:hypothetical protein [Limnohabitans sp. TS-CS-82]|uniref:hypothetical protein n=1 Tax=Limnohabitans sp. TS-CS-82 TaxID=2094193 RepID=UPI00137511BB|nr:hypothetical protein [Limnohabitans sp. TS-CS-82]